MAGKRDRSVGRGVYIRFSVVLIPADSGYQLLVEIGKRRKYPRPTSTDADMMAVGVLFF